MTFLYKREQQEFSVFTRKKWFCWNI